MHRSSSAYYQGGYLDESINRGTDTSDKMARPCADRSTTTAGKHECAPDVSESTAELGGNDKYYHHPSSSGSSQAVGIKTKCHPIAVDVPASLAMKRLCTPFASSPVSVANAHSLECVTASGYSGTPLDSTTPASVHPAPERSMRISSRLHSRCRGRNGARGPTSSQFYPMQPRLMNRFSSARHMASDCSLDASVSTVISTCNISYKSAVSSPTGKASTPTMSGVRLRRLSSSRGITFARQQGADNHKTATIHGSDASISTVELRADSRNVLEARTDNELGSCGPHYTQNPLPGVYPSGLGVMPSKQQCELYHCGDVSDTVGGLWSSPDSLMLSFKVPVPDAVYEASVSTSTQQRISKRYVSTYDKQRRLQCLPIVSAPETGGAFPGDKVLRTSTETQTSRLSLGSSRTKRRAFMKDASSSDTSTSLSVVDQQFEGKYKRQKQGKRLSGPPPKDQRQAQPSWLRPVDHANSPPSLTSESSSRSSEKTHKKKNSPPPHAVVKVPGRKSSHVTGMLEESKHRAPTQQYSPRPLRNKCASPHRVVTSGERSGRGNGPLGHPWRSGDKLWPERKTSEPRCASRTSSTSSRNPSTSVSSSNTSGTSNAGKRSRVRRSVTTPHLLTKNRHREKGKRKSSTHGSHPVSIAKRRCFLVKPLSVHILSKSLRNNR